MSQSALLKVLESGSECVGVSAIDRGVAKCETISDFRGGGKKNDKQVVG